MAMRPGTPRFVLRREGKTMLDVMGRRTIIDKPTKQNSRYFGSHLPSRIWAGTAVAGASTRIEAEDGLTSAGADIRGVAGARAVHLPTAPGAAVEIPVEGLQDGMHNIRFRYSNPHDYDRSVTLYADGVEREETGRERYRIPLWLPPTGEGQWRTYPWGEEEPEPMVQGNFQLKRAVEVPDYMRSQHAQGVVTVGNFPEGASRDGVMDLAGNVAEWCSDWYQMYGEGATTDPLETRESHSRLIRGGSWGYYGYSQRSADREFNSPVYPGYIFVGFRVALPQAGWEKVRKSE
jgi:hypothetical protein